MSEIAGVLIVEDEFVIGLDTQQTLEQRGVTQVHLATTLAEAEEILRTVPTISAALLDYRLGQENSALLAEELTRRDVPFVVTTGYGDRESLPSSMSGAPCLSKPYSVEQVMTALAACLADRPNRRLP